jgi:hypothetical protein
MTFRTIVVATLLVASSAFAPASQVCFVILLDMARNSP